MNRSSQGPRCKEQLSESLIRRVNAYALATGAAGVSLMALAQPAEAEIVYTPANATIPFDRGLTIDLNHDGRDDFRFFFYTFAYHSFGRTKCVSSPWWRRNYRSRKVCVSALPGKQHRPGPGFSAGGGGDVPIARGRNLLFELSQERLWTMGKRPE